MPVSKTCEKDTAQYYEVKVHGTTLNLVIKSDVENKK